MPKMLLPYFILSLATLVAFIVDVKKIHNIIIKCMLNHAEIVFSFYGLYQHMTNSRTNFIIE